EYCATEWHRLSTRLSRHPAQPTSPFETAYGRRTRIDAIPHRPIATLALVPHPQQGRMPRVDEVDDAHIGLAGVFPVQATEPPRESRRLVGVSHAASASSRVC